MYIISIIISALKLVILQYHNWKIYQGKFNEASGLVGIYGGLLQFFNFVEGDVHQ